MIDTEIVNNEFAQDVKLGLSQKTKRLFSKYFYDEIGDKIFQDIMKMEEYYLTKSEFEIFSTQKEEILNSIAAESDDFQLIEFGAGDGLKTKILLKYFLEKKVNFEYVPIDISENVLAQLKNELAHEMPDLKVNSRVDTYFKALDSLTSKTRKVILLLGSNIGNFTKVEAEVFLTKAATKLNSGDRLMIGVDLKKHPSQILAAYNDKNGITKAFNLNLLTRINREFDGDFDISKFDHYPTYDPISGETKSFIISQINQTVYIDALDLNIEFSAGEHIFMEVSKKYSLGELEELARTCGFYVQANLLDCKQYFVDTVWVKK